MPALFFCGKVNSPALCTEGCGMPAEGLKTVFGGYNRYKKQKEQ